MPFTADIRQFTLKTFADYLDALPRPDWPGENNPRGSVYHNTYRPTEAQWAGRASMVSMQRDYTAKGWSAGPHFFLALGSPNPKNDGIWQMTPPTVPGVHGVSCNPTHFGIELVGDFQARAPSLPQQQLLIDVLVLLHRWAGLGPRLIAHRDCITRTCPGQAFYDLKPQLVARLTARLHQAGSYRVRASMWVSETPTTRGPIALDGKAAVYTGDTIEIDEVRADGYAHLANGVGFVPIGGLERL
jgi:hypothetical protein